MKVIFSLDNYTKCLCPVCPVQATSGCIVAGEEGWRETRKAVGRVLIEYPQSPEAYEIEASELEEHEAGRKAGFTRPAAESMRELYCSIGKSGCADLDSDRRCVCPDCVVWKNGRLGRMYFCFQGSMEEPG